ncbi:MAG: TonB-dependent receptor [Spirochaetes bacterium]|nr:TonB-dependent receptor [Spirochaetota bacterium]
MLSGEKYSYRLLAILIAVFVCAPVSSFAQDAAVKTDNGQKSESKTGEIQQLMEEGMKEIDFYSLEELLNVEIEVASLFAEDELVVGSMVSSITSDQWKRLGARRQTDALSNELSVVVYPFVVGYNAPAIRGYATDFSSKGIGSLLDGVPVNDFTSGTAAPVTEFGLGTLDRIEMIKGPGSAIYGSDAFHGVISMKTFESEKDQYSIECAGAYPLYGDGNIKISQGFADNFLRLNMAASTTGQTPLVQKYDYDYPGTVGILPTPAANGSGERDTAYKAHTGVLKLTVNPGDKLKINLGSYVNYGKFSEFPGIAVYPSFGSLQKNDTSGQEIFFFMENGSIAYKFINDIAIETNGYFWQYTRNTWLRSDMYNSTSYDDGTESRSGANFIVKQADNAINLQWLFGYSLTYFKIASSTQQYLNMNPDPETIESMGEIGVKNPKKDNPYSGKSRAIHSVYTQTKFGVIKDYLYLLAGGRIDNYSDFGNQYTPRGGLIFLPEKKSSIKALYGRAFRAASASEVYGIYGYTNENKDIKPETIDIYELIFMHKGKKWKVTINGYYSKWENGLTIDLNNNILEIIAENEWPFNTVNKGKNTSYGGEGSIFYSFEPFAVDLGISYNRSKALDVTKIDISTFTTSIISEEDYVAFPEYIANAGFYYTLNPVGINFYLNNRFYYKMKETHYNKKNDPEDLPLYWRMDLNVHKIIDKRLELILDISNILDRENRIPSVYGAEDGYVEPGTSVLLRAGYRI